MIKPRTLSRRLALQYCFMCDLNNDWSANALTDFLRDHCENVAAENFARELSELVIGDHEKIDAQIKPHLRHWELARVAAVERNILRVAVAELNMQQTDKKIIITEAIHLAKHFGDKNSGKFINGVLDAIINDEGNKQ